MFNYNNLEDFDPWFETEDFYDFDSLFSEYEMDDATKEIEDQNQSLIIPHPNPQRSEVKPMMFSSSCLEILKCYAKCFKDSKGANDVKVINGRKLSVCDILSLAGQRHINLFTQKRDHVLSGAISTGEMRDVEIVNVVLLAAEGVSRGQYCLASSLISRCLWVVSESGNPVQRLTFQFAEALVERIERETGRFTGVSEQRLVRCRQSMGLCANPAGVASHQGLPFSQVMQFAGVQAIIENVKAARKIHVVDFNIRSGIQWTILMQALAGEHIELIKITAIGVMEREKMEECRKWLCSFATSLNLPFSFNVVFLSDLKDFREDLIHVESDEVVAVYANTILRNMIQRPECLDSIMREIRGLKPTVMVVEEVEANHNAPSFIHRFVEALFFFGAYFDCLEDSLDRDDPCRRAMEGLYFGEGIRNVVAAENEERFNRSVRVDVWRSYFARFGMVEMQLSESSLYQANLVRNQFVNGGCCTLECSGKGLIIGWKGTPVHSLTTWKFS